MSAALWLTILSTEHVRCSEDWSTTLKLRQDVKRVEAQRNGSYCRAVEPTFVISDYSSFLDASAELSRVIISIKTRFPMVRLSKESLFNQAGVAHIFGQKVRVTPTWSHRNLIAP